MRHIDFQQSSSSRLRMVFKDRVLSYDLTPAATFGDVASALSDLALRHYHRPLTINFTMPLAVADVAN